MAKVERADEEAHDARAQSHESGLLRHGVTHNLEEVVNLVPALVDHRVGHAPGDRCEDVEVEVPFVLEVEEELALRHARAPRYVRRGHTGVVIASEHLDRRVNDGAPAVLGKTLEALEPT